MIYPLDRVFRSLKDRDVWDASLLVTVGSRQCLDMIVGKIENDLERGFVKHRLNCLLITDPMCLIASKPNSLGP